MVKNEQSWGSPTGFLLLPAIRSMHIFSSRFFHEVFLHLQKIGYGVFRMVYKHNSSLPHVNILLFLVGGWAPSLWKIWKSIGRMKFPIYRNIKVMFQTTNQIYIYICINPNKSAYFPNGFSYDFHVPNHQPAEFGLFLLTSSTRNSFKAGNFNSEARCITSWRRWGRAMVLTGTKTGTAWYETSETYGKTIGKQKGAMED